MGYAFFAGRSMTASTSSSFMMNRSLPSRRISWPERHPAPVFRDPAVAGGDHRAALRLLFGAIRDDDPADLLFAVVETVNDDAIVQRSNGHEVLQTVLGGAGG
jgi:hypothetical protein